MTPQKNCLFNCCLTSHPDYMEITWKSLCFCRLQVHVCWWQRSALNLLTKRELTTISPHWSAWKYEDRDDVDYPSRTDQKRFSHLKRNQSFKNIFSSSRYLKANDDFIVICCKWKIYTGFEKRQITKIYRIFVDFLVFDTITAILMGPLELALLRK